MDLAALKARIRAARELVHEIDGRRFTLLAPTPHELKLAYLEVGAAGAEDLAAWARAERLLLERGLQAWAGVTTADLLGRVARPDEAALPVDFSVDAVPLLLDAQPRWAAALGAVLTGAIAVQAKGEETAAKN